MQTITLGSTGPQSSRLAYGCMRIAGDGSAEAIAHGQQAVRAAIDAGYTLFDHADIYGGGQCEQLFGAMLKKSPNLREQICLLTKCGIRREGEPQATSPKRYDFSASHLIRSVEDSLRRLHTDYIDILLLHRPDYLMDASDTGATLDRLHRDGKVRDFGVSNFSASQVLMLQKHMQQPLICNQIEINLHNINALTNGTLDQCQQLGMTPQAWCPLAAIAYPAWENTFSADDEQRIQVEIKQQALRYDAQEWQIALAWLLKHPAGIVPLIGSTTPARIATAIDALAINYSHEDWYRLLEARNGKPVA